MPLLIEWPPSCQPMAGHLRAHRLVRVGLELVQEAAGGVGMGQRAAAWQRAAAQQRGLLLHQRLPGALRRLLDGLQLLQEVQLARAARLTPRPAAHRACYCGHLLLRGRRPASASVL